MTYRRFAVTAGVAVLLVTAACSTNRAGSDSTTTGTSRPLSPLLGTFATVTLPTGVQSLDAVDCPTALRCWAVGSTVGTAQVPASATVVTTANGGATWKIQPIPTTVGYLTGIACTDEHTCTAVGQVGTVGTGMGAILVTHNSGRTWTLQAVPANTTDVTAVSCAPEGTCMALADIGGRVTALSTASAPATGTPTTSTATSTPATGWVAGGALPATVSSATGISCIDADQCWATVSSPVDVDHVAGGVLATADGGATWTPQTLPTGSGALQGIQCTASTTSASSTTTAPSSSTADCTAVGTSATAIGAPRSAQGVVLTTSTGGTTWSPPVDIPSSSDLFALSCNAGPCVAVGTTVAAVPQAGLVVAAASAGSTPAAWQRARTQTVPLPLAGVSCVSLMACVVVGESVSGHLSTADG